MVEVSLTVGKLDASLALLLTKDHHLIEFPTILLPNGVKAGSIVKISCERDWETEEQERQQFLAVQNEILSTFGKNLPKAPILRIKNVTQTSCVLEWDPLDLGTSSLKSLTLFRDGKKLGAIPQPLSNRTTKLSGLPIEKSIHFQLKLDSTAGVYTSETIEVTTHKMTDLSGIRVCLGDITPNEQFTVDDIQQALKNMGAHYPASNKMQIETTHFVTTRENKQNAEFLKANDMSIPIIRPEWLKACEKERRIVGVRDFYVKECVLPDIFAKNYWKKSDSDASIAAYQNKSTGEAHKEEVDKSQARKEEAGESEFTTDNSDIPSLAVSAPLSDVQDLETPRNTPTDVTSQKNESEETDGAIRDIEYVSKASDHINLGGHKNVESDEETKAELLDSSSGNATGIKDAETTAKEIETEEADLKSSTGPTNLIQHQESDSGEDVSEPKIEQQKEIEFDESKNSPNTQKDLVSAQEINETETKSREETSPVEVKEEPELQNIVPMPESDKTTQTIKAAKPTEPTETTESEESTETTKQIEPTESTESTKQIEPTEPTEPTVSTKQIEPTELAEKASLEEVSL